MTLTIFHQKSLLKISLHRIKINGKALQYSFSLETHKYSKVPFNYTMKNIAISFKEPSITLA